MRVLLASLLMACGGPSSPPPSDAFAFGPPTGSSCPPATPTYDSFGRDFMERYCTRCHAKALVGDARMGAPADHNFDSALGVRIEREHIDESAAGGPSATNLLMPPTGPFPTDDERLTLGGWLACGAL